MAESEALRMAKRAEMDLNSYQAKQGLGPKSDSSMLLLTCDFHEKILTWSSCRVWCERDGRQEVPSGDRRANR